MTELWQLSATEVVARLRKRDVSPLELIDAALARIAAVDKPVNALPTVCAERARAHANRLDGLTSDDPGWLAGLPIAIKDTADVAGVRSTYGSPIYAYQQKNIALTADDNTCVLNGQAMTPIQLSTQAPTSCWWTFKGSSNTYGATSSTTTTQAYANPNNTALTSLPAAQITNPKANVSFTNQDGVVDLVYKIEEGEPYLLGELRIVGNARTRDKVLRREIMIDADFPRVLAQHALECLAQ